MQQHKPASSIVIWGNACVEGKGMYLLPASIVESYACEQSTYAVML